MLAVLLVGICGISAIPQNEFHYTKMDMQTDKCNVCYNLRCYTMDRARCRYYSFASDITGNNKHEYEPQNEIIDEVDDMIFEYAEKASNEPVYKDCIPLLSQYTNCNRDNICSGCKTCNCDSKGRWNCSQIQHCRPDPVVPLNHHTLVVVMENLNDYKDTTTNIRTKRSVVESEKNKKMNPEEVLKWMYGVKRSDTDEDFPKPTTKVKSNTTNRNSENVNLSWSDRNEIKDGNESESEPLHFEDLMNNLNVNDDIHISLEDKTPLSENIISEVAPSSALNRKTTSLSDTTILDDEYQRNKSDTNIIDDVFAYINSDIDENFNYKRDIKYNTRRIEKRNADLQSINVTSIPDNNTDKIIQLQHILLPFTNIIQQKQEELNKLIDIKEKLITYIKSFSNININNSFTNYSNSNVTQLYFIQLSSIQNFDEFRKRDANNINKYLQKFKRDVEEVVRDIDGIQRLSNDTTIPYDLKILIRAIKNYVSKENKHKNITNYNNKNTIDLRKKFDTHIVHKTYVKPIDEIIKVLEVLDSDMPTFNVTNTLTPNTRKILTRLLNTFYKNNATSTESQINRTYNLIRNLESIGKRWNDMTIDIATNSLSQRLYSMRLFYLDLSVDIEKIEDALVLLQFAQNRRMTLIDNVTGGTLVDRILNDLRKSGRRFHHIIQIQTLRSRVKNTTGLANKSSKKKSFLQRIKILLKNSKMDIRQLLNRKVPKSEIVKHITKNEIDEIRKNKLAEYERTMQRWQDNLNIISRNKRSAGSFRNFINSIKHMIPGYRRSYKKKGNKTEKVKKRSEKRGNKKTKKITSTSQKTIITTNKQK